MSYERLKTGLKGHDAEAAPVGHNLATSFKYSSAAESADFRITRHSWKRKYVGTGRTRGNHSHVKAPHQFPVILRQQHRYKLYIVALYPLRINDIAF